MRRIPRLSYADAHFAVDELSSALFTLSPLCRNSYEAHLGGGREEFNGCKILAGRKMKLLYTGEVIYQVLSLKITK